MHSSSGNAAGMAELAAQAKDKKLHNVGFLSLLLLGRVEECIELLVGLRRLPAAAFLARPYRPSQVSLLVALWALPPPRPCITRSRAFLWSSRSSIAEARRLCRFTASDLWYEVTTTALYATCFAYLRMGGNARDSV